jgi:hypothetical protein
MPEDAPYERWPAQQGQWLPAALPHLAFATLKGLALSAGDPVLLLRNLARLSIQQCFVTSGGNRWRAVLPVTWSSGRFTSAGLGALVMGPCRQGLAAGAGAGHWRGLHAG